MPEVWIAAIGTAVSVGATAYSLSQGGPSYPRPPKPIHFDVGKAADTYTKENTLAYQTADAAYNARFPQLVSGRNASISSALSDLEGNTPKTVSNALKTSGLAINDLGNNPFKEAIDLGKPILSQEQRHNQYFQSLFAANPERQISPSGGEIATAEVADLGNTNAALPGIYANRVNLYNAGIQQQSQNISGLLGAVGGAANVGANIYNNYTNPYLNFDYYKNPDDPYNNNKGSSYPGV